jgi:hypothetical protein
MISQLQSQIYTPTLLWYQNSEYVFLTIQLQNVKNERIELLADKINFSINSNSRLYEMNFELFELINSEQSKYTVDDKSVKIVLKKENSDKWSTLTKDKNLYKNSIKVDWNSWVDDEDDEDTDNMSDPMQNQQFDFQKMMASMQGMGDMQSMMQGMGGIDNLEEGCEDEGCEDEGCEDNECLEEGCEDNECLEEGCEDEGCLDEGCEDDECLEEGYEDKGCEDNECLDEGCEDKGYEDKGCEEEGCEYLESV